jgi:hypothetical protein
VPDALPYNPGDSWSGSDSEQTCLVKKSAEITNVNSDERVKGDKQKAEKEKACRNRRK